MSDDKRKVIEEIDPDAPPSAEEIAASKRLRDALDDPSIEDPDADLARSLRAAFAPEPITAAEHAALVDDIATPEEIALANELRDALADKKDDFAVALKNAWAPTSISEAEHRAIVAKAIGAEIASGKPVKTAKVVAFRRQRVAVVVTGVLALAASVWLYVSNTQPSTTPQAAALPLAHMRSTAPLFQEPFKAGEPTTKATTARIDRIAMARSGDYRNNRFAKWGVR